MCLCILQAHYFRRLNIHSELFSYGMFANETSCVFLDALPRQPALVPQMTPYASRSRWRTPAGAWQSLNSNSDFITSRFRLGPLHNGIPHSLRALQQVLSHTLSQTQLNDHRTR